MVERESPKFLVWVRFPPSLKLGVFMCVLLSLGSSMVERATVNREVVGSSPIRDGCVFNNLLWVNSSMVEQ